MIDRRYQKRIERYLAKQEQASLANLSKLELDGWFDYWHLHPDWKFKANRFRLLVAALTYRLLQKVEELIENRKELIQTWAFLHENTGNTAIYLHSPNPNSSPFPYDFEGVDWGISEPEEIYGVIKPTHEIGLMVFNNEYIYVIRKR